MLLTGDIESSGEARLEPGPAAVLKVPHHGSRSSSTPLFLGRVQPGLAVVSVGRNSRFGHPHPEVLDRYRGHRIQVLRTDHQGTVTLSSDGAGLAVRIWH
jgi:competence protein ComEC